MSDDMGACLISFGMGLLLAFVFMSGVHGVATKNCNGTRDMQRQAVEMGVAEWVVTDAEGTVEFRWRDKR